MPKYAIPKLNKIAKVGKKQVLLVASGDLRLSANQNCWAKQKEMEDELAKAVTEAGYELVRAHPYKETRSTASSARKRKGSRFSPTSIPTAKLIVAEAVWQYSHHVLAGLARARGTDPDRGQLVGHLAGTGRHAEPQRLADQGRQKILHPLERRFHRRVLRRRT